MSEPLCFWYNGEYLPPDQAVVPIRDLGFTRSYGAFEFLKSYNRKPFMLEKHIDRLFQSLDTLGLSLELSQEQIKVIVENLVEKAPEEQEVHIKIYATAGTSDNGLTPDSDYASLYILSEKAFIYPQAFYEEGIKTTTIKGSRFLPQCKYTNYLPGLIGLTKAKKADVQEVLYLNENEEILEGVASNFFGFQNNRLITASDGVLEGITRDVILELAKNDFSIEKRAIEYSELSSFDEVFLSSTAKEIMPIRSIDHMTFGEGVGPRTKRLMQLFYEHTHQISADE